MRLTLAAIVCAGTLTGLLNMKRFALKGDRGEAIAGRMGGPSATLLPFSKMQVRMAAYFYINIQALESCGQDSDTTLVL